MTFSIAARTPDARLFGIAIASSSPAVGARCAHARAQVGAVATQNVTDPALARPILEALARGASAAAALDAALSATPFAAYRQVLAIGREGPPAVHSGTRALGTSGTALGPHAAAAGNLLARAAVPQVMLERFAASQAAAAGSDLDFGAALLDALRSGLAGGGEAGPIHSAALLVVREVSWPIVDLRIDWSDADPLSELQGLWERYAPQLESYVARALDPCAAPSFGVPGDP